MRRQTLWLLSLTALLLATLVGGMAIADVASADRGERGERGRGNDDHPRGRPAHIAWEQREVEITLAPGETKAVTVHFSASEDIAHATLAVRPGHAALDAAPGDLGAVRAGQSYSITLTAQLPADERRPHRRAQVFVHDAQRALGPPLRVDIRNTAAAERDEDEDDDEDAPAHLNWTPALVVGSVQAGGMFTTTASFVSDRALDDARVRVRTFFGLDLDVEPKELGDVAADQAVTLTLSARAPTTPTLPILLGRVQILADDAQVGPLLWVLLHVTPAPAADQTAPVVTASQSPEANINGWNNADVQVTLSASDNEGGSGVAAIHYRVNGGAEVVVSGATAAFTVSAEGASTITCRAVDAAGNTSAESQHVVRIDRTPPSVTATQTSTHTVTLAATDNEGGSGVADVRFRLDGGSEIVVSGATATIVLSATTTTTVTFRASDRAGNVSAEQSLSMQLSSALGPAALSLSAAAAHVAATTVGGDEARGEPAEPAQPAQPAQPGEGAQPAEPAQPAQPAEPALPGHERGHGAGQATAFAAAAVRTELGAALGLTRP